VEQCKAGYCKVCRAMLNLPIGERRASKADRDAQAIVYTKVKVGQNRNGFYFGVTQDAHWRRFHLGGSCFIPIKVKDLMDKLARLCLEYSLIIQITIGNLFRQRLSLYFEVLARSVEGDGDGAKV
jgi:hypothetical protein